MNGGTLQVSVSIKMQGSLPAPGNTPSNTIRDIQQSVTGGGTQVIEYGTGDGKADVFCAGEFVLAPLASITFDLYAGTDLLDIFSHAAPMRVCRSIDVVIAHGTGDAYGVLVGGAGVDEFAGWFRAAGQQLEIFPDCKPFVQGSQAGKPVTATARNFKIQNLSPVSQVRVRVYAAGAKLVSGMAMGTIGGTYP